MLRHGNDMVNDDCTLVVLRVSGGSEEANAVEVREEEPADAEATPHPEPQGGSDLSPAGRGGDVADLMSDADAPAPANTSPRWEERSPSSEAGEGPQDDTATPSSPSTVQRVEDIAIAADVGDLMLDIPHDPPRESETPRSPEPEQNESPPTVEPPAARDGFPESTDTRD
jgi:hypothetical protein